MYEFLCGAYRHNRGDHARQECGTFSKLYEAQWPVKAPDLRNQSGRVQAALRTDNLTLTANGAPFALMIGLREGEDPAQLERAVALARAQLALQQIRRAAQEAGTDRLTPEEIEAEIRAVRAERRS